MLLQLLVEIISELEPGRLFLMTQASTNIGSALLLALYSSAGAEEKNPTSLITSSQEATEETEFSIFHLCCLGYRL